MFYYLCTCLSVFCSLTSSIVNVVCGTRPIDIHLMVSRVPPSSCNFDKFFNIVCVGHFRSGQRGPTYSRVSGPGLLSADLSVLGVRVDQVPDGADEPRLEDDAGQRQQGQLAVVPNGHSAHEHVRVGLESAEGKFLPPRRPHLSEVVDGQDGAILVSLHVHFVPSSVVQVPTHRQDLGAAAQVVPQSETN